AGPIGELRSDERPPDRSREQVPKRSCRRERAGSAAAAEAPSPLSCDSGTRGRDDGGLPGLPAFVQPHDAGRLFRSGGGR
ncbi:hypothetical protein DF186_23510, partial [Enterococcus hirae]